MPSAPRDDRSNRRLQSERAHAFAPARCCALAIVVLCLAFLATIAPTPIASAGAQESTTQRRPAATRVATAKTPTIVALELSRVIDGVPQLPEDAVERTVAAAAKASGLVLLDIRGLPLRHASLPPASQRTIERDAYERGLSLQLAAAIEDARGRTSGVAFGILGLPFEQGPSAAESNASYEAALQAVDVMNPLGGVIAAGTNPTAIVRDRYRSSLSLAEGRPVVFRGGSGWQVATSPSNPPAHRGAKQVVAKDDGAVTAASATAAGTAAPSVSTVVADWGTNASGSDLNADGTVDGYDLAVALASNPNELLTPPPNGGGSGVGGGGEGGGTPPGGNGDPPSPPVLQPGVGFDGTTAEPPAVSGPPGHPGSTARAIARWTSVPYRNASGLVSVSVLAFHINDIDRVEFSVDGSDWEAIAEPTHNPNTGLAEYHVLVDASAVEASLLEVRAIAYPTIGVPRVLAGQFLNNRAPGAAPPVVYASAAGSDEWGTGDESAPVRTIFRAAQLASQAGGASGADGAEVRLLPGDYEWRRPNGSGPPVTSREWLTIGPAPGVARADVRIVQPAEAANDGLLTKLVRLKGVTIRASLVTSSPLEDYLWLDGCHIDGMGESDSLLYFSGAWWSKIFVTDTLATSVVNGFQSAELVLNSLVDGVFADAFPGALCVALSEVRNHVGGQGPNGPYHPDVWQERTPGTEENIILFRVTATQNCHSQGVFSRTAEHAGVAIVECKLTLLGYPHHNQWRTRTSHMLVQNNAFLGAPLQIALSDTHPAVSGYLGSTDALWRNNVFQWLWITDDANATGHGPPYGDADLGAGTVFESNHFINLWPDHIGTPGTPSGAVIIGEDPTTGPEWPADRGPQM